MFKQLGTSFLDTFKKPYFLIWIFLLSIIVGIGFGVIYDYTLDYLANAEGNFALAFIYLIKNHLFVFLIYLLAILLTMYLFSLFCAYVLNKKAGSEKQFSGTGKLFGFSLFLLIISLVPTLIANYFIASFVVAILFFILYLFYVFFLFPVLFCVPVLLINKDLNSALNKSFGFAKKHIFGIIVLQFLFVIVLMILEYLFGLLGAIIGTEFSVLLFLLVLSVLVLWGLHFTYNWYYSEA